MRYTLQLIKTSVIALVLLTVLTGLLYPALITLIGETVFKDVSNGSMTTQGSTLIGQTFSNPKYFWGRPSATTPYPDNGASSSGSNLAPSNPALAQAVAARIKALQAADPTNHALVPIDLVTASGSGLDPDISPAAAYYQAARVAKLRHLNVAVVKQLIAANTTGRQFGFLGEPRVNVLQLNTQLDALTAGNKVK